MGNGLKHNLSRGATWWRALYMVLFAIFYSVAEVVLAVVVIFQFLTVLIRGRRNERLQTFGQSLSSYIYQVLRFLTFNSERHPYPFSDWPVGQPVPEEGPAADKPQPAAPQPATPQPAASPQAKATDSAEQPAPAASAGVAEPEQPFEPAWAPEPPESAAKPSNPEPPESSEKEGEAEKREKTEASAKPEKPDDKAPG